MKRLIVCLSFIGFILSGCSTEPGETTGMTAAAGGLVGAGLGAIVGSATGDPGVGLAIGAATGAATGAVVGNYIEAQDKMMAYQDKAIEKNAEQLHRNENQLKNLRNFDQDTARFSGDFSAPIGNAQNQAQGFDTSSEIKESTIVSSNTFNPEFSNNIKFREADSTVGLRDSAVRVNLGDTQYPEAGRAIPVTARALPQVEIAGTGECREAAQEVSKVTSSTETADKLFHYRRALRLCPENAQYHNTLGEVYLSLGRNGDAEFEFKEALRLNPGDAAAQRNLSSLTLNG